MTSIPPPFTLPQRVLSSVDSVNRYRVAPQVQHPNTSKIMLGVVGEITFFFFFFLKKQTISITFSLLPFSLTNSLTCHSDSLWHYFCLHPLNHSPPSHIEGDAVLSCWISSLYRTILIAPRCYAHLYTLISAVASCNADWDENRVCTVFEEVPED